MGKIQALSEHFTVCYIDDAKRWQRYKFEYPIALPYKDGDVLLNGSSGQWNQSLMRARLCRGKLLVSQNASCWLIQFEHVNVKHWNAKCRLLRSSATHLAANFHFPPEIPNVLPQLKPSQPHLPWRERNVISCIYYARMTHDLIIFVATIMHILHFALNIINRFCSSVRLLENLPTSKAFLADVMKWL